MTSIETRVEAFPYKDMTESAQAASDLLRALSHETRLMLLCMLADGEKSVGELEELLELRQSTVSQQLARLRADRLVEKRRDGKSIFYSLASSEARIIIETLYELYCKRVSPKSS